MSDVWERCEQKLDDALAQCGQLAVEMDDFRRASYRAFLFLVFMIAVETFSLSVVIYFALLRAGHIGGSI